MGVKMGSSGMVRLENVVYEMQIERLANWLVWRILAGGNGREYGLKFEI